MLSVLQGRGGGEARTGGQGSPLPRLGPRAGSAVVTLPGSAVPAVRRRPPTQRGSSCRGCHPRECQLGPGRFLSSLFFVFFQCHSKGEEEKEIKKKKGKQLLRDDSELFAKVPFIVTQGGRPSPPRRKDFQRVLGPCLAASLSRVPHLTRTLPRGDVPLPRGHRPPGGPSPRPPVLVVRGLESRMGPLGVWVSCGGVWVGRGPRPPGLDRMPWVAGAQ